MKAKYCKCKNTYTLDCTEGRGACDVPYYWFQGIGSISAKVLNNIFDDTFDSTFN